MLARGMTIKGGFNFYFLHAGSGLDQDLSGHEAMGISGGCGWDQDKKKERDRPAET